MLQPGFSGNVFAACDSSRLRSVARRLRVRMMRWPRRSVRPWSARKSARFCSTSLAALPNPS